MRLSLLLMGLILTSACSSSNDRQAEGQNPASASDTSLVARGPVQIGAKMLAADQFSPLRGRRVGLIVNHTAMVDSVHLIDLIHRAPDVELTALYGPEHGLRGTAAYGELVDDGRDTATGVIIHSLYGETRKPTQAMLEGVDVLVFDIQDVGARFYTYISTMGLAMQAAAEQGIPFIVLDRPNPLDDYVAGPILDPKHASFVGQFPITVAHGMTVGELAQMVKGEAMLPGLESLELQVIKMDGWQRDMLWPETGLPWIPPSPNMPDFETALIFPGAAFIEATSGSEGRGTRDPFKLIGAEGIDGERIAAELNQRNLPGVRFEPTTFTLESIPSMAPTPKLLGKTVNGIRYHITDQEAFNPTATGVHVLHAFYNATPPAQRDAFLDRPEWLTMLSGTEQFGEMLRSGATAEAILAEWEDDVARFRQQRAPYLLY